MTTSLTLPRHRRTATAAPVADATTGLTLPALLTLISGVFLPILSFFVINVALPAIGTSLRATPAQLQLVVGTYGIAYACLVVVGGRLGDNLGRRRLFLVGLATFTVASVLCGLAGSIGTLLVLRVVQGAAAAMTTPQVLATISAVTRGESRLRAFGLFGAAAGVAAAVGQILGGLLVSADLFGLHWRSVFLVNLPLGLLALAAAVRAVPATRADRRTPIDGLGAVLLGLVLVLLLLPLTEGRPLGWPVWTWALLAAVVPVAGLFVAHQRHTERHGRVPLLPPSLFAVPAIRRGLVLSVVYFSTFGGFMFVIAVAMQTGAGLSPLHAGVTLLPFAASFMVLSTVMPRLQHRWGAGVVVRGLVLMAVGYAGLAATVLVTWPSLAPTAVAMAVMGAGGAMVMLPLFGVVLDRVPADQAGAGSGALVTTQQTCLALGAAVLGTAYLALQDLGAGTALAVVAGAIAALSLAVVPLARHLAR